MAMQPVQDLKLCRKCGEQKPATTEFFVKKLSALSSRCKPCLQEGKRAAWAKNAVAINTGRRASRGDDARRKEREYYSANSDRVRANVAAWRAANPEKRREIDQRHYSKFADKKKRQAAEWSARNADRKRENTREWYRKKRKTDPMYRLRSAISAYVYWCLKARKNGKRTEALLGYTINTLRAHLERQFLPGMSWENYGEWHVDHILPVASFNFSSADDPEFRACWALTNLRPLWAADNLSKSDKRVLLL